MIGDALFRNRREAGRRLAEALAHLGGEDPLVLALPRGGVPVGFEVATALAAPLDVLLVRKIGMPGHEELAIGAVVEGADPQLVLNEALIEFARLPPGYVEEARERQLAEIERRRRLYQGTEPALPVLGRTVIVVDDGIATGATVKAAPRGIRLGRPRRLVLAVPLAPQDTLEALAGECDEIACLASPEPFHAVGLHYEDFGQTGDAEVVRLLRQARAARPGSRAAGAPLAGDARRT